jgi:hypothetical protein
MERTRQFIYTVEDNTSWKPEGSVWQMYDMKNSNGTVFGLGSQLFMFFLAEKFRGCLNSRG